MAKRADLKALRNMIAEADLILSTTTLPQGRAERAHELLGTAVKLADHLLTEKPAAVLGKKGGKKTAERGPPESRFQLTTDGLRAYRTAADEMLSDRCDFGQLIKFYSQPIQNEARYSPARMVEAVAVAVSGDPNPAKICTSHIERFNLTLRMSIRRMTRLTNGFSKKWEKHKAAISLQIAYYNLCRIHQSLRVTPAMQAGITDHLWSIRELLEFV